ncbi:MAG: hypothetical protein OEM23_00855 [Gemmatimonadota bacterium]|nr:hypothetical protein [Gemmatimonadota bacterium]MDH3426958.1 hypothetical protein [Gemmatimonadota bacterium]
MNMVSVRMVLRLAALAVVGSVTGGASLLPAQESPHGSTTRPLECTACHTQEAWRPVREPIRFDHSRDTEYTLEGAHVDATCGGCHIGWNFAEPRVGASDCGACHVDVHLGNLSTDCTACHTTESFRDLPTLQIHLRTAFPLTGVHGQVSCESCHVDDSGGMFTTLNPDCVACHREDYENATSIDHVASGFPTDCSSCHNTIAFGVGIQFEHALASGGFRLLGAHDRIPCAACHVLPGFEPLFPGVDDQDCIGCHQPDFDREHLGTGFPTTCLDCHTVETWSGGTFKDHDPQFFPILSGPHRNKWTGCGDCHEVPGDFSSFTCLNCHEHRQSAMDDKHSGESGYVYESSACLDCHPDGRHE